MKCWLRRRNLRWTETSSRVSAGWLRAFCDVAVLECEALIDGRACKGKGRNGTGWGINTLCDAPVVVRDRAAASNRHVAQRADGVVGVAADGLRRDVAGHVDD